MGFAVGPEILYAGHAAGPRAREIRHDQMKMLPMLAVATAVSVGLLAAQEAPPAGFAAIFNGKDLTGWGCPRATTATGRSSTA